MRLIRTRFVATVNYYEMLFYASERGDVDADLCESRRVRIANFIAPAKDIAWEPTKLAFGKRFREFVDRELLPGYDGSASPWMFGQRAGS